MRNSIKNKTYTDSEISATTQFVQTYRNTQTQNYLHNNLEYYDEDQDLRSSHRTNSVSSPNRKSLKVSKVTHRRTPSEEARRLSNTKNSEMQQIWSQKVFVIFVTTIILKFIF